MAADLVLVVEEEVLEGAVEEAEAEALLFVVEFRRSVEVLVSHTP